MKPEKIKVLVADDEKDICELFREYVTAAGGKVDLAYDGERALEYLNSKDYDFVFLDCNMPELTGVEIAELIKGKAKKPIVVMMTGYGPMDENFAKATGVDVYLTKPLLLADINKIIKVKNER